MACGMKEDREGGGGATVAFRSTLGLVEAVLEME